MACHDAQSGSAWGERGAAVWGREPPCVRCPGAPRQASPMQPAAQGRGGPWLQHAACRGQPVGSTMYSPPRFAHTFRHAQGQQAGHTCSMLRPPVVRASMLILALPLYVLSCCTSSGGDVAADGRERQGRAGEWERASNAMCSPTLQAHTPLASQARRAGAANRRRPALIVATSCAPTRLALIDERTLGTAAPLPPEEPLAADTHWCPPCARTPSARR